jgi:hypothetical protein
MSLLNLLEELFRQGGITVETAGARSVLQVDGQILVQVTPQTLSQPTLWKEHLDAFHARLAPLARMQLRLGRVIRFARYFRRSPLLLLSDTASGPAVVDGWMVAGLLAGPVLGWVMSGVVWLLVYRARRHLERLLAQSK